MNNLDNNEDSNSNSGLSVLKRLSVNQRLSDARIFDEDSNDSPQNGKERKGKVGKMRSSKKNNKGSPYKTNGNKKNVEYETDPSVLERRQKQIDYGKNTIGYDNYLATIPMNKRKKEHPKTPNKYLKYSRRGWDCLVKIWRMKLHEFDPKNGEDDESKIKDDEEELELEDLDDSGSSNIENKSNEEKNTSKESVDDVREKETTNQKL